MIRFTQKHAVDRLALINPRIEILGEYTNKDAHLLVKCLDCQYEWHARPGNLWKKRQPRGCPKCGRIKQGLSRRVTNEEFLERMSKIDNHLQILGEYVRLHDSILVRCMDCGRESKKQPSNLLHMEVGCKPCSSKRAATNGWGVSKEEFVKRLASVNDRISLIGDYINTRLHVSVECLDCHNKWRATPTNLLRNFGCPVCRTIQRGFDSRTTHEEFEQRVAMINPRILILGRYTLSARRVSVSCFGCGFKWSPIANSLLSGSGCRKCAEYGFNFAKPGIVYYVRVSKPNDAPLYKIGVTNRTVMKRFKQDRAKITLLEIFRFKTGIEAWQLEQKLLQEHKIFRYRGPDVLLNGNEELFTCDVLNLDTG